MWSETESCWEGITRSWAETSNALLGRIFTQPVHEVNDTEGVLGLMLAKRKGPELARASKKLYQTTD
jgi:hypothetical protein